MNPKHDLYYRQLYTALLEVEKQIKVFDYRDQNKGVAMMIEGENKIFLSNHSVCCKGAVSRRRLLIDHMHHRIKVELELDREEILAEMGKL